MKTISPALLSFLIEPPQSGIGRADLISITLPNSMVLNVNFGTNLDITYNGTTYYCSRFGSWERSAFTNKADFKPTSESMELSAFIQESVLYPGTSTSLMQVINVGMLVGATVNIQTLFWPLGGPPSGGFSMGTMQLTKGQIGNVKPSGRSKVICEVFDLLYILNRPVPPFSIQTSCRHNLFDAGCTLNAASFTSTAVALDASSTNLNLNLIVAPRSSSVAVTLGNLIDVNNVIYFCSQAGTTAAISPVFVPARGGVTNDGSAKWTSMNNGYVQGYVLFTGGQNAGLKATVKLQAVTTGVFPTGAFPQLQLIKQLPFPVAGGDTVVLVPGCDKTLATCLTVYNNLVHIGSTPYVPNPEVAQ